MQLAKPVVATNPRLFGRGRVFDVDAPEPAQPSLSDDVKLFAATFCAGFLFVAILIA